MTVLQTRIEVERIINDVCRQKGARPPEVTDIELAAFCVNGRPSRQDVFRFAIAKISTGRAEG